MNNIFVNLKNETYSKSILLITDDLRYNNCLKENSNIKYNLIDFDKEKIKSLSNLILNYDVILFDNKNNNLSEFDNMFRVGNLNNFNIPIIILDDELSLDLTNNKYLNIYTVLPRDINTIKSLLNISLCINYINYINYDKKIILRNGFYFDINSEILFRDKKIIVLSNIEKKFVKLLIQNINMLVDYETIEEIVWKNKRYSIHGLRNIVKSIRDKTEESFIKNFSNIGYTIKGV